MTVFDWATIHSSSVLPPGTCGVHGYHGCVYCPRCNTSALPPERLATPERDLDARAMADAITEAQRIEHAFSVAARHERAVNRCENVLYPSLDRVKVELELALTSRHEEDLLVALRRLASIGELARFEAEKLEGRA